MSDKCTFEANNPSIELTDVRLSTPGATEKEAQKIHHDNISYRPPPLARVSNLWIVLLQLIVFGNFCVGASFFFADENDERLSIEYLTLTLTPFAWMATCSIISLRTKPNDDSIHLVASIAIELSLVVRCYIKYINYSLAGILVSERSERAFMKTRIRASERSEQQTKRAANEASSKRSELVATSVGFACSLRSSS